MKTCKGCSKRAPGCHDTCLEGIQRDKDRKERQAKIRKEKDKDHGYMAYKTQTAVPKAKWP